MIDNTDNLPEGWTITALGDLCRTVQYGWTTSAIKKNNGLKLLRTTDISSGLIDWKAVPACKDEPSDIEKYLLSSGDIVISRAGSVGVNYLIRDCPKAIFASYLIRLKPHKQIVNEYIANFLNSKSYWIQISDNSAGIAVPNVNASKLKTITIPLAPLPEQKRIADKIGKLLVRVNKAKEKLDKVPAILKRFRQSVLSAACSGKLTEEWRENHSDIEPTSITLKKVLQQRNSEYEKVCKDAKLKGVRKPKKESYLDYRKVDQSILEELPKTWNWVYLPLLGELNRGRSRHRPRNALHLYGGLYPFVQTGDIAQSRGRITNHKQTYNEEGLKQSRLWPEGTVCITIAANIADSAILTYPACFPDSVVGLLADERICNNTYAEFFIRTARNDLSQYAPATAQKNINLGILSEVAVPTPPVEEQQEIVCRVEKLFALADKIESRLNQARQRVDRITQSILAKAFRGELVPTEAELTRLEGRTYETAAQLLARIQAEKQKLKSKPKPKKRSK